MSASIYRGRFFDEYRILRKDLIQKVRVFKGKAKSPVEIKTLLFRRNAFSSLLEKELFIKISSGEIQDANASCFTDSNGMGLVSRNVINLLQNKKLTENWYKIENR